MLLLTSQVCAVAIDIAVVGLHSTKLVFSFRPPPIEPSAEFHHVPELAYRYDPDWKQRGRQQGLAIFANTGVIRCYGIPRELVPGAIAQGEPGYRGEAYVVGGAQGATAATARVTHWTPNTATVHYDGAPPGSTLVYNMNYEASWRADGEAAANYAGAVATPVTSSAGDVTFHYYPRTMNWALLLCALTATLAFGGPRMWKRRHSFRVRS